MITDCKSCEHRAVLRLLTLSIAADPAPAFVDALIRDLKASDPVKLAAIANAGHVHTVLHSAADHDPRIAASLPSDLWLYFSEMQKANALRRANGLRQLNEIGTLFASHGVEGVVLKGGADLLDPLGRVPEHRFVSDLDILMPLDAAKTIQSILLDQGGSLATNCALSAPNAHHLPPIEFPGWEYPVELHEQVGQPLVQRVLPPNDLFARSLPSKTRGLRVPSMPDRFVHHILHSMVGRFDERTLYPRALLDQASFQKKLTKFDLEISRNWLSRAELDHMERALDAQSAAIGLCVANGMPENGTARHWAQRSLRRFGQPQRSKLRGAIQLSSGYAIRFFTDHGYRRYYLDLLGHRGALRRLGAVYRDKISRIR